MKPQQHIGGCVDGPELEQFALVEQARTRAFQDVLDRRPRELEHSPARRTIPAPTGRRLSYVLWRPEPYYVVLVKAENGGWRSDDSSLPVLRDEGSRPYEYELGACEFALRLSVLRGLA